MNIEQVREYALTLPEVTEDMPFGDDNVVFRIEGKIFLCLLLESTDAHFAIKLTPERNEELRAQYDAIVPAWHWNKKHWSDIYYEREFTDAQIEQWIEEAYRLVLSKLPKAVRSRLTAEGMR